MWFAIVPHVRRGGSGAARFASSARRRSECGAARFRDDLAAGFFFAAIETPLQQPCFYAAMLGAEVNRLSMP